MAQVINPSIAVAQAPWLQRLASKVRGALFNLAAPTPVPCKLSPADLAIVNMLLEHWVGDTTCHAAAHALHQLEHTQADMAAARAKHTASLQAALNHGTPEAICYELINHWTVDTRTQAQIQQRQAAVWCAIVTPMVAQRSHSALQHKAAWYGFFNLRKQINGSVHTNPANPVALTPQLLVQAATQWLTQAGHTSAAQYCQRHWALRQLAKHPKRMYDLCLGSAHTHGVPAPHVLCALVLPVMQCLRVAQVLQANHTQQADMPSKT